MLIVDTANMLKLLINILKWSRSEQLLTFVSNNLIVCAFDAHDDKEIREIDKNHSEAYLEAVCVQNEQLAYLRGI